MKKSIALAVAVACLPIVGCQSTAPPAPRMDNVSSDAYPVTATGGLDRFLARERPIVDRSDAGTLTVTVPVRILRDKEIPIEYRFSFFSDLGQPLRPGGDWQYKVLPGRTQQFLVGTALDLDAADWRLEIRPAR